MHKVRDAAFWEDAQKPVATGESYDLVIVGGGISGLAAAHYFRKATGDKARILILDNHETSAGMPSATNSAQAIGPSWATAGHTRSRVPRPTARCRRR